MHAKSGLPENRADTEVFVEVIGLDGLAHHVGPFASRDEAEEWIAQNSPEALPSQTDIQEKFAAAKFDKLRARPLV